MKALPIKNSQNFKFKTKMQFNHIVNHVSMNLVKYISLFILLVFISSCSNEKEEQNLASTDAPTELKDNQISVSQQQFDMNEMHLVKGEERNFPASIPVNGMIDVPPRYKAVVYATTGGYINTSNFMEGDYVRKGQVIATIENPELVTMQQEYLELSQDLNYLKTEMDRQKLMYDEKITAQKNYLKAQSEYNTAKARHSGLKKQLTLFNISPTQAARGNFSSAVNIYAPIAGYVMRVNVIKGTHVSPSTEILEIVDNNHLHVELTVFEKDAMNIEKGQKVLFSIPEMAATPFEAEVYLIGKTIDADRTVRVFAHLSQEDKNKFLTGMFVEAEIVTKDNHGIALPETAVAEIDDSFFALKLKEKAEDAYLFEEVEVEVGETKNRFTQITSKIDSTAQFLDKGVYELVQ